ncbi:MAG: Gfo/Idh/MocA family oxidoreductase [Pseudomonadota bacterium]
MNLYAGMRARETPVGVALIGAGKFGAMFLNRARHTPGLRLIGIADLNVDQAGRTMAQAGWDDAKTPVTDDAEDLIARDGVEIVIEATGHPAAGLRHAATAIREGRHLIMVNVEADVLAGPLLARDARAAGLVYSLAYGDQPALIAELVDWGRAAGFKIVCAGKGTKYLPAFHQSTPETVWSHYGVTPEEAKAGGMNPKMFNSFLDGTKSGIEMAAVANATGLTPPDDGLGFPPVGCHELSEVLKPQSDGGQLPAPGMVEVVSSLARDGSPVADDLRWGVYVTMTVGDDYAARCFREYGMATDASGRYTAMWKPYHLIGLELGISVASIAVRGEPTGSPQAFRGDAVAVAKRDLKVGELLDGEGGATVWGKLVPAQRSLGESLLPIGLAQDIALRHDVGAGQALRWADVVIDDNDPAVRTRRAMENTIGPQGQRETAA